MLIWVVGRGGLLGSAVVRRAQVRTHVEEFVGSKIPWSQPDEIEQTFRKDASVFASQVGARPWAIIWVAGHASVSSSSFDTELELKSLQALLKAVNSFLPQGPGKFFLASSAGGVYAGSQNPPFDIDTETAPLSPYGELKLDQEALVLNELSDRCAFVIGRLSNIYGPGQDLQKMQGLISALVKAAVAREPINIFVSLDTIRDYLFADDAADMILNLVDPKCISAVGTQEKVILASGQPVPLGYLINLVQDISRVRIPVALGAHASAAAQSRDLRLLPTTEISRHARTSLPAGIKTVYLDVLQRAQSTEQH